MAERCTVSTYLVYSTFISAFIYPAGLFSEKPSLLFSHRLCFWFRYTHTVALSPLPPVIVAHWVWSGNAWLTEGDGTTGYVVSTGGLQ